MIENLGIQPERHACLPVRDATQIPFLVDILTENIIHYGGNLSTARWECSDAFLDYGFHQLIVTYYRYPYYHNHI